MSVSKRDVTGAKWRLRGSEQGWSESNGSILTTLESVAIMPFGDLAA